MTLTDTNTPGPELEDLDHTTASSGTVPRTSRHILVLDGMRGLAILMVMLCHFVPYSTAPKSVIGRALLGATRSGQIGVDLFFVLSGFLITGILYDAKGSAHYFRNFYARRILRIFPLYYGVLVAVFLLIPLIHPSAFHDSAVAAVKARQSWLWTYSSNIYMTHARDETGAFQSGWLNLNPFWSLAVEEHFYLVWPVIVCLLNRRSLIRVCVGFTVIGFLVRAIMIWQRNEVGTFVFTGSRVDALAIGALLAVLIRGEPAMRAALRRVCRRLLIPMGILALVGLVLKVRRVDAWYVGSVGISAIAVFFGAVMVCAVTDPPTTRLARTFNFFPLRYVGKYAYGLYVYHVVLGSTFDRFFGQAKIETQLQLHLHLGHSAYDLSILLYIILAGLASYAIAWLSWQLVERQFLKLKRYFEYTGEREKSSQPSAVSCQPEK